MMRKNLFIVLFLFLSSSPSWGMRIISLLPSNTETLEALGAGDDIVGITIFEPLKPGREAVGDLVHPNLEKIVSLKPDLIVAGVWKSSRVVPRLRSMGYQVVEVPNPHSLEEMYAGIHQLAKATGREDVAERVVKSLRVRFELLREENKKIKPLRTYIEVDTGLWTLGGPDFTSEAYAIAGAQNIFSDIAKPAVQVSAETIVDRNPEVILCLAQSCHDILARPGWENVAAIKNKRVITDINADWLSRPSPLLAQGIEQLAAELRPWREKR